MTHPSTPGLTAHDPRLSERPAPRHEGQAVLERHDQESREQLENNFLPNTRDQGRLCLSYRHEEPTSPGTCISLRTRRSQVRVLQGRANSIQSSIFALRTVVNSSFATVLPYAPAFDTAWFGNRRFLTEPSRDTLEHLVKNREPPGTMGSLHGSLRL